MAADLQLDWLRVFVAAVDGGSLAAAGPVVHRSPSAVTMQIRKLEAVVGRPLLLRGPRRTLEPTTAGLALLAHARRLLALHDEALAELHGPTLSGRLRIGVPDDYATPYLTPVLRAFGARHDQVEIVLDCLQSTQLIPRVQRGDTDLALVTRDRTGRGRLLFHEPLVWVGSARYPVWQQPVLPVAVYEHDSIARRHALTALTRAGRAHRIACDSAGIAGQRAAVDSGLAIAVFTRCSVPESLRVLDESDGLPPLQPLEVALIRSRASRGVKAVDAFVQSMVRTLAAAGG